MKNNRCLSVLALSFASLISFFVSSQSFAAAYNPDYSIKLAKEAKKNRNVPLFILQNQDLYTVQRVRFPIYASGITLYDSLQVQFEDQRAVSIYPDIRDPLSIYQRDNDGAYVILVTEALSIEDLETRIYPNRMRQAPSYENGYIEFAIYYPRYFSGISVTFNFGILNFVTNVARMLLEHVDC